VVDEVAYSLLAACGVGSVTKVVQGRSHLMDVKKPCDFLGEYYGSAFKVKSLSGYEKRVAG
jgi:hypothetical protein